MSAHWEDGSAAVSGCRCEESEKNAGTSGLHLSAYLCSLSTGTLKVFTSVMMGSGLASAMVGSCNLFLVLCAATSKCYGEYKYILLHKALTFQQSKGQLLS